MEIKMLTQEQKKILLDLLNNAQVSGNRQQIGKMLEKLDELARVLEAMPTEPDAKTETKKKK
jgi:hypothetical protein